MTKKLIIVESPAKMKTLRKFLGHDFIFESSVGHIRDLPKKGFGIDVEHNFEPVYDILPDKTEVVQKIKKAAKSSDIVYLSTDPDREGEAIAWHIAAILPPGTKYKRVPFNALTKNVVLEALKHPRDINQALVDAQQARRLLDRIVGYKISPILTRRVQGARDGGLSAGRVQSVALKLVVDREKEIEHFIPIEYWNIGAMLQTQKSDPIFYAGLYSIDGRRVEKTEVPGKEVYTISSKQEADSVVNRLQKASYKIMQVEKKEKKRNPVPPFITSTLQQEASRHFGFSASRTMSIAQGLYEGIDMGDAGTEGLITYMRTDSVRIEPEAIQAARNFIVGEYGKEYLPHEIRQYTSKKTAQDAHEAIRPTNLAHPPETIRQYLSEDQFKLYQLIWRRFIACQMNPAIYDTVTCDIETDQNIQLRATGSTIKFLGFLAVYEEKEDTSEGAQGEGPEKVLPMLQGGQSLHLNEIKSEQAFTRAPPRFTEASLVKELERLGIGRPSTYTSIMNKIQSRDYTVKEKGTLKPTELGRVIARMLEDNFSMIMDIGFTVAMEDELEHIASKEKDWKTLISEFWHFFIPSVEIAEKEAFVPKEMTDIICPKCKKHQLQKIWSRRKFFYGCSGYPDCDFTASIEALNFKKEDYDPNFNWEQKCPKCGSDMLLRFGKFGPFLGCTKYPECHGIINIPKQGEIPAEGFPPCPALGCDGKLTPRRSRFGKVFYSCTNFPDCDVIINDLDKLNEKYVDHPKTPYVKKTKQGENMAKKKARKTARRKTARRPAKRKASKRRGAGPLSTPKTVSPALAAVIGTTKITRPQLMKKLWQYIKRHDLQDSKNRRMINPDEKLSKVLGSRSIDMMQMTKVLSKHIH
ncbi:MAG TPA: type I DNA topoisomerase [Rhabdochlamydiaceae bacterium]|nr:type I DNA topoisomerase [Rhabdochlamydiaceae bacterium]